jgi:hypothetical protein
MSLDLIDGLQFAKLLFYFLFDYFQMNGFELAGRAIKVGHITDRTGDLSNPTAGHGGIDYEETGRTGD